MARYQTELLFDNRQISLFTFVAISLGSSFFSSVHTGNHGFQSRTSDTCQTRATSSPKIHPRTRDRRRRSRLTVDEAREFDRANSCVLRRLRGFGSQMATIHTPRTKPYPRVDEIDAAGVVYGGPYSSPHCSSPNYSTRTRISEGERERGAMLRQTFISP